MAMGQACGAMAALGSRTGIAAGHLPLSDIRAVLKQPAAIISSA